MKILCISSHNHPGVTAVWKNFISVIPNSKHLFLQDIPNNYPFDEDLCLLGAWENGYDQILPKIKGKKAILWTSSILQSTFTPDYVEIRILEGIKGLLNEGRIDYIFVGDKKLYGAIGGDKIHLFSYPVAPPMFEHYPTKWLEKETKFFLFTVNAPRKNIPNHYEAFRILSRYNNGVQLHTNTPYLPMNNVFNYGWLSKENYDKLLENTHFGLSVFPSESFCFGWLEMMARGVPSICSLTIAHNFGMVENVWEKLIVMDCDNCCEIALKMQGLVDLFPYQREKLSDECRAFAVEVADRNNNKLKQLLISLDCQNPTQNKNEPSTKSTT